MVGGRNRPRRRTRSRCPTSRGGGQWASPSIGSTLAQWDALRAIGRTPGVGARELAAATFQSEQAFGTLAGRLVAQGLVDRRAGTADGSSTTSLPMASAY
jgi:DNA-binding MarR family transcriptional regulator